MDTNDLTFYIDFVTIEMGKLISGKEINKTKIYQIYSFEYKIELVKEDY